MPSSRLQWIHWAVMFAVLLVTTLGWRMEATQACSRGDTPSLEEDYAAAAAVFTGKVIKIENVYRQGWGEKKVSIEPGHIYKGEARTFVLTAEDSDQCGAGFEIGDSYLFYGQGTTLHLGVSVFDRFPLEYAKERIDWLERHKDLLPMSHNPGDQEIEAYYRGGITFY